MGSNNTRGNREQKKPKKVVPKMNASNPSTKGAGSTVVASVKKK